MIRTTGKQALNIKFSHSLQTFPMVVSVGGMPWLETGATHYYAQLEISNKGLVVCNSWDLEPLDLLKQSGPKCCYQL